MKKKASLIEVGDVLFSTKGKHKKVTEVYKPRTGNLMGLFWEGQRGYYTVLKTTVLKLVPPNKAIKADPSTPL